MNRDRLGLFLLLRRVWFDILFWWGRKWNWNRWRLLLLFFLYFWGSWLLRHHLFSQLLTFNIVYFQFLHQLCLQNFESLCILRGLIISRTLETVNARHGLLVLPNNIQHLGFTIQGLGIRRVHLVQDLL